MAFELQGRTCVLTGAGSGIGRATALLLARSGCNLALADLNPASLASVAAEARGLGVTVSEHVLDVSDAGAVAALPEAVLASHPRGVDVLVNNAGVALLGTFDVLSLEEFEWLFNINFWGVVRMTHAFLPVLRRAPKAHVVNLSSIFGVIAPAGQSAYVAAKFGVRGFSESIRQEWRGSNLSLTVVHPGGIKTAIAKQARVASGADQSRADGAKGDFEKLLITTPEAAGRKIVHAIKTQKKRLLIGIDAVGGELLQRTLPVSYNNVLDRLTAIVTGKDLVANTRLRPLGPDTGDASRSSSAPRAAA